MLLFSPSQQNEALLFFSKSSLGQHPQSPLYRQTEVAVESQTGLDIQVWSFGCFLKPMENFMCDMEGREQKHAEKRKRGGQKELGGPEEL